MPHQNEMARDGPKEHIERIRRDKFGITPDGTREQNSFTLDLRAALRNLAEELNARETHFILELLQNAEDNTYRPGEEPELSIFIDAGDPTGSGGDGCLCLLNNEVGFTPAQVLSLCSYGLSTKDKALGYIGEKGIGFKSVFRVSDQPHIFSNGYQFRFQKPRAPDELGYIEPHWVESVPGVVRPGFTAILLPLVVGRREGIAQKLATIAPESILFLRQLRRLRIGAERCIARDNTSGFVRLTSDATESQYFVQREIWQKPADLLEEKRDGITEREVTIAFPLKASSRCTGRVFAFLPTEFDTGVPFLVDADFLLSASRESVLVDPPWNKWLRDRIAPTFVKAFLSLINDPAWREEAYRFLPIASDLTPGADLFAPIVGSVQERLRAEKCILTKAGDYVLPKDVFFAGAPASRLLRDAPAERAAVALLHPALERHWERLKPLGIQSLTFAQLFDACNDDAWLRSRDGEWWETLFDLLVKCKVSAETVDSFPLLRCRDGKCRPLSCGVFFHVEGQPTPASIPVEWPTAYLLDADLQSRVQQQPAVWEWLTGVAGLRPFSLQSYIAGPLLAWMRERTGEQLIEATRFIAANLKHLDAHHQALHEKMPWLLADNRVLLPEARVGKELVTPECIEGDLGWNWVFISEHDRQHFWVLSDAYVEGQTEAISGAIRRLMEICRATDFPDPAKLAHPGGLVGWSCPRWLRDLTLNQPPQNLERKAAALERWIGRFKQEYFAKFLMLGADEGNWPENAGTRESELGFALRNRPWLRSTKGLVSPSVAFVDDPEIREFLHDSFAYTFSTLQSELLGKLGVRLRLSAATLLDLLRQMRDSGDVDEALVVRIYRRLQTMEFNVDALRGNR